MRCVKYIVLLLLINNILSVNTCAEVLSLNISKGNYLSNGVIEKDNILYTKDNQIDISGSLHGCVCNIWNCVRKCCPDGYGMVNNTCRPYGKKFYFTTYNYTEPTSVTVNNFFIIYSNRCTTTAAFRLDPDGDEVDVFYIQRNGMLYLPLFDVGHRTYSPDQFCLENFVDDENIESFSAIICNQELYYQTHGMIISMPFLLVTFLVYAVLPDRNLHGKCLMCYVITLFGAYVLLVFIQLYPNDLNGVNCKTIGIFCYFFFMVSFFWMNAMSIDIWWAFSGLRGFSGSRKEAERKRFILYSGYAWGASFILAMIVIGLTLSNELEINTWYNPGMGDGQCWFRDGVPTLIYFYAPMATIILGNISLFAVTAYKIKQVQQDTAMLRKDESKKHTYENDKQRFNLYLKLMLAMGVNWAMEIISWIVDWQIGHVPPAVWYLTDFCNALYGVFVFFIFVFKRNIWTLLNRRYYMLIGKPHLARSMTQTAYSPRTTGSSLNHTISTDKNFVTDSSVLTSEVA